MCAGVKVFKCRVKPWLGFLISWRKPLSVKTQIMSWQKLKGCSSCFFSSWLLPVFSAWLTSAQTKTYNLCDPVSMAMHAGCCCSGTQAEGGYSIQNPSLLCKADNSGREVAFLNPEALHVISCATKLYISEMYILNNHPYWKAIVSLWLSIHFYSARFR